MSADSALKGSLPACEPQQSDKRRLVRAGPGVYDVHSPAVPPVDALRSKIKQFVDTGVLAGHPERLWVNPDCGLKTRDWVEARPFCVLPTDNAAPSMQGDGGVMSIKWLRWPGYAVTPV